MDNCLLSRVASGVAISSEVLTGEKSKAFFEYTRLRLVTDIKLRRPSEEGKLIWQLRYVGNDRSGSLSQANHLNVESLMALEMDFAGELTR